MDAGTGPVPILLADKAVGRVDTDGVASLAGRSGILTEELALELDEKDTVEGKSVFNSAEEPRSDSQSNNAELLVEAAREIDATEEIE